MKKKDSKSLHLYSLKPIGCYKIVVVWNLTWGKIKIVEIFKISTIFSIARRKLTANRVGYGTPKSLYNYPSTCAVCSLAGASLFQPIGSRLHRVVAYPHHAFWRV